MKDLTTGFSNKLRSQQVGSASASHSSGGRDVLWVTSFNRPLYENSARKLIRTFADSGVQGHLLMTYEGMGQDFEKRVLLSVPGAIGNRMHFHVLDYDSHLRLWLNSNRDIIPYHLGGTATQCDCPGGDDLAPATKHSNPHCHWTWWNRNCSRWFRKIPSLEQATAMSEQHGFRYVVWIDCDCYFTAGAWEMRITKLLGDGCGFFLKGPRKVPECGIVCYDMQSALARGTMQSVFQSYDSGLFRTLKRWDDSFVWWVCMQNLAASHRESFTDLAKGISVKDGHVVAASTIGPYVRHNKGEHARKGLGA